MRLVHDILVGHVSVHTSNGTRPRGPVISFIQHGTADTGWRYENVCPFCEKTVGWVNDPLNEMTNAETVPSADSTSEPSSTLPCTRRRRSPEHAPFTPTSSALQ